MNRTEARALAERALTLPRIVAATPRKSGGSYSVHITAEHGATVWHKADDDSRWNPPA
jgi:hypothetical protein